MKHFITILLSLFSLAVYGQGPILGTTSICAGFTTSLSDATAGGTWSSSNVGIATIGSSTGIVTGLSAGTTTITYTVGAGNATTTVTVNPTPGNILGSTIVCPGTTTTLSDATPGGIWSSSSVAVATIGLATGIVTGTAPGTATISYTLPSSCYSTTPLTVNPMPGMINGNLTPCLGTSVTLTDATAGGTWSSSNTTVGTINPATGVVTGISLGSTIISYTLPSGCSSIAGLTVNPMPGTISGGSMICSAVSETLSDATAGGIWSSSNTAVGTINSVSGVVTGISPGTTTISYTASGCSSTMLLTVNFSPASITGTMAICSGASTTLNDAVAGGAWSSSSGIATISAGGIVTGLVAGTATISYTLPSGCNTTSILTVNPLPASISGSATICSGTSTTLNDITPGGTWSSSNPAIETIGPGTGVATGVAPGTATIYYSLPTNCSTTTVVTVNASPAAITGPNIVCSGNSIALTDATGGGTWASSDTSVATIIAAGIVSGLAASTSTISYTLPSGCYTTFIVTVNTTAPISGATSVCGSSSAILSDMTPGGTWSVSNITIATIGSSTGIVTGVSIGVVVITYVSGGCFALSALTVDPLPGPVTGGTFVCIGETLTLNDTDLGGTWSSSNAAIATISFIGGSSGVVTGISTGTVIMTYSMGAGCYVTTVITVNVSPTITVSATPAACGGLYLATASGGTTYSWSPSAGVSCTNCATTYIDPVSATYLVTGTSGVCSGSAILPLNNNRIYGHISFDALVPAPLNMKVWLIRYNPADSSLAAIDSTLTCADGTLPYYEFDSLLAGNYFVKSELLSSTPGITGYVPTYGAQNPHWDSAQTITHTSTSDSLHITMLYGIVPPGSGFISGYIVTPSGSATAPVPGMLIYLLDDLNNMITYTYTDGSGAYSFGGLAHGGYVIYPENYDYYTTPSGATLSYATDTDKHVDFIQHNTERTIKPYTGLSVTPLSSDRKFTIYPNPASTYLNIKWTDLAPCDADVVATDMLGREVYRSLLKINTTNGQATVNINGLGKGIYILSVKSATINFCDKLLVE